MATKVTRAAKRGWVRWLNRYGGAPFLKAFLESAQDAESHCVHCGHPIYLDVIEGGGVPDWKTADGDYGCNRSPETTAEGTGGHEPRKLA